MKYVKTAKCRKSVLFLLYIKVWDRGRMPGSWKEAIIITVRKPGKDASRPGKYRLVALTSYICKLTGCMINERLMQYSLGSRGMVATYQSVFRKGRGMDPVLYLEDKIRKAQVNKAHDMLQTKGLLMKLHLMGI